MGDVAYNKEDIQSCFGQVLRKHRNALGISQEKLAFASGLDRTYISLLERGLRAPSLWIIFLLANELNISPKDLVGDVEQELASYPPTITPCKNV